jgi:hypothetical protein
MTDKAPRPRDFDISPDPLARSHHRSSPSASFRHPPHGINVPAPARDPSRQAELHLDFLIIGGGLFYVLDIISFTADMLFHQESLGLLRRTPSLHRATV